MKQVREWTIEKVTENSKNVYEGDGVTTQFAVSFTLDYLSKDHVFCHVEDEEDGLGAPIYRTLEWVTDGLVDVGTAPGDGLVVDIFRVTPNDVLYHDYNDGAGIVELNLDESNLQTIMLSHEATDGLSVTGEAIESANEAAISAAAAAVSAAEALVSANNAAADAGSVSDALDDIAVNTTHVGADGSDHADVAANTAVAHAEQHTVVSHSDTTMTGAQGNELVAGNDTVLHSHLGRLILVASDLNIVNQAEGKITSGFTSASERYLLVCRNFAPASDDKELRIRFSTDGGATYRNGGSDYSYGYRSHGPAAYSLSDDYNDEIRVTAQMHNGGKQACNMDFVIYNPASAVLYTQVHSTGVYQRTSNRYVNDVHGCGLFHNNSGVALATNAIRLFYDSGLVARGDLYLYRVIDG